MSEQLTAALRRELISMTFDTANIRNVFGYAMFSVINSFDFDNIII